MDILEKDPLITCPIPNSIIVTILHSEYELSVMEYINARVADKQTSLLSIDY